MVNQCPGIDISTNGRVLFGHFYPSKVCFASGKTSIPQLTLPLNHIGAS